MINICLLRQLKHNKTFSPSYSPNQITYVEAEAVGFSRFRFRFHRKRTASSFRFHIPAFNAVTTKNNYQHQHVLLRSTAETCSSWFSEEINHQLHMLLPLDFPLMQTVFPRAKITHRLHYEHSHLWVDLLRTGLLRTSLLWMLSVMNVVWYERGLLRTACMISYEHGLLWTWSVMNMVVCYDFYELVCYELVCYEWVCCE